MKPVSLRPPECTADSYMDKLPYVSRSVEAQWRNNMGDRQTYCAHCKLCRWLEEQRSCKHFSIDHELEAFYDAEEKKSQEPEPKRKRPK